MRRLLNSRVFSLALSLWIPVFMTGSEWIVRCPAHAAVTGAASADDAPDGGSAASHDHGGSHPAPGDQEGTSHSCSCPGPSCGTAAVAVVRGTDVPMSHVVAVHEATAAATLDRLASETDHVLPFATAPPAVALAPAATNVA